MNSTKLPQLILLDGATGAGKTSLLAHLRRVYSRTVLVGTKLTTRRKRLADNEWEFRFVEHIPEQYALYSFQSVGNYYAIDYEELSHAVDLKLIYAISCVDREIMERLIADFNTLAIYVYRSWTATSFEELLASRGTSNSIESHVRRAEVASIASQYLRKLELFDHVILNIESESHLIEQLSRILLLYGISRDVLAK